MNDEIRMTNAEEGGVALLHEAASVEQQCFAIHSDFGIRH